MNLDALVERSKNTDKIDSSSIECRDDCEPLVKLVSSKRLLVEPIWIKPIDDIEGPLYQSYIKDHPAYNGIYLRQAVAKQLKAAAKALPEDLTMILRAGHRPLEVQKILLDSLVREYLLEKNPTASADKALEFARTYVSDPAIKIPPHCCGAAVDVDAMDKKTGKLLDFGCPVNTDSEVAFLHSPKIGQIQHDNRMILLKAMLKGGFAPNPNEWWHYSYGDQAWAHFYNKPEALYGLIEPKL